jgi:dTMP kinase
MANIAEEIALLRGTRPATLRDLLTDASFSRLWRAMLVSSLGDWVGFVAVVALVARLGRGASLAGLAVAGVMLARLLPSVLFGPFAGVLADRFDRRTLMVRADIARGVLYGSMPFMPTLWAIFLLSFLIECLSLAWTPAKDASIPNLVPRRQLPNANSISLVTTYGTLPLGALIYTALAGFSTGLGDRVEYFGGHPEFLALWLDALTFFFSAWMVAGLDLRPTAAVRVRIARVAGRGLRGAVDEVRQGFRFLRRHPMIRSMTIGIVMGFGAVGAVIALGPVFARYSVNAGATGFGYLVIGLGIGMGGGMALLNWVGRIAEKETIFPNAMFWAAGWLFLLASVPTIALAFLFSIPMGVGVGLTWVTGYTMLQENVADEFRGRTFATLTITARMALFLSLAAFPALASAIGEHHPVIGGRVVDLSGTRVALYLAGLVVVAAGAITRRGLGRGRLARAVALQLSPGARGRRPSGLFVAFEGIEGSGKGTQIRLARDYLRSKGRDVVVTREPGGTGFGDRLRETILDPSTGRVDGRAEALLFAAARAHLVAAVVRPALDDGRIVLCDRFVDSSLAYQGVARGVGEQDVLTLNAWATQGLFPDLVILLDLPPEEGLARTGQSPDRIESEDLSFHARVWDAYLKIAEENPDRFRVIDATLDAVDVQKRIREVLDEALRGTDEDRGGAT